MDTFASMLTHPLVQRLGWALLHSLWQGLLASLLLGFFLFFVRRRSAGARYLCSCAALMLSLAMPTATLFLVHVPHHAGWISPAPSELPLPSEAPNETPAYSPGMIEASIPPRAMPPSAVIPVTPTTPSSVGISERLEPYLPWAVLLWLVGVCILSLRLLGGWVKVQRIKRRCVQPAAAQWQEMLDNLMHQLRISRPVRLLESALVQAPAAIGWLKPVILLPACALSGLTPDQLRMILAHELAHIRRYDYLVNLLQTVIETLLFYHPAVWWISRRIRAERENCCDDIAVAAGGRPLDYARALTELESLRGPSPSLVAAASGGSLLERIRRILNLPSAGHNYLSRSLAGLLLISIILTATISLHLYSDVGWASEVPSTTRPTNDDPSSEQVLNVTFRDAGDLNQLVRSGGNWKIKNNELLGTCGGDQSWATCRTSFKRISSVLIRGQIVPPSTQNFRVWVGPIHLIFNWEMADQNHYRTNQELTVTQPHALTAGQWHDIEFKQNDNKVVVTVDGKTVYQTTAELAGTISVQSAWNSTIAVQQIRIVGVPDPAVRVEPLAKPLPDAAPLTRQPDAVARKPKPDLSKCGTLTTKVTDRDGQPAEDVSVFIISADQSAGLVQTNQEGIFSSDHAPAGRYTVVAFKGNRPPAKGWKDHQGYLMGAKRDVQVTAGETTTVQLQPPGTANLDVTLAKPDPYHLEWGIVLLALSPIELPTGQTGKAAAFPIPADLLGMFFVEPGKPCTIHNLPEGLIHVRATPSDPGPMDFSSNIAITIRAGQKNTLDLQLTPRNRFEGKLEFDKDVKIGLSAPAGDTKDGVSLLTMKFSRRDNQLSAEMKLGVISWPKTKWRFTVDLLDSQGKVLKSIQNIFENSGIALGFALLGSEKLELNLGPWSDVSAATRFAVSIEQISSQTPTRPAAVPAEFDLNQKELFFHGLDLSKAPVETNVRRLPDLWHAVPPGSGSYERRPEVQLFGSGLDGVVYWLPDQNMFYVQHDHLGSSILHYYGPFRGDPRKILNLPSTTQPTTTTDEPLWGEAVEGAQIRLQPEKKTWKTGETPTFRVDARNTGARVFVFDDESHWNEIEIDGQWYKPEKAIEAGTRITLSAISTPITLAGEWEPLSDKEVAEYALRHSQSTSRVIDPEKRVNLTLSPGRHTIRVAYIAMPARANTGDPVRVVSNSVEIEVLSNDPANSTTQPRTELPRPAVNKPFLPPPAPPKDEGAMNANDGAASATQPSTQIR